jgi:hypothetical protein
MNNSMEYQAEQNAKEQSHAEAQNLLAKAAEETYYIPTMAVHKKYRARIYDAHDTTYATHMAKVYYIGHNQETKEKFNTFTDFLMDESAINRHYLLDAIDDYNKTTDALRFPLSCHFCDSAFNYRPYQMW